jgi:hypothetical protein
MARSLSADHGGMSTGGGARGGRDRRARSNADAAHCSRQMKPANSPQLVVPEPEPSEPSEPPTPPEVPRPSEEPDRPEPLGPSVPSEPSEDPTPIDPVPGPEIPQPDEPPQMRAPDGPPADATMGGQSVASAWAVPRRRIRGAAKRSAARSSVTRSSARQTSAERNCRLAGAGVAIATASPIPRLR